MIASQFNLDQHIAELLPSRTTEYADQAVAADASPVARIAAILRSLIGGTSTTRPVRAAAH
jgi:hypothetical protein